MALRLYPHDSKILRTIVYTFLKYSIKIPTWLETRHRVVLYHLFVATAWLLF